MVLLEALGNLLTARNKFNINIAAACLFASFSLPCFATQTAATEFDSYQFVEGQVAWPLYHVSLHIHFKHPYDGKAKDLCGFISDWYIGGLSSFRRNQVRPPILATSLRTDRSAKVLGVEETGVSIPKPIDHKLAVDIVDSAIFLKDWLPKQQYPYWAIPFRGVGLTSNTVVRAILKKNNAYGLWSELNYPHIAPGTGPNDPGIPDYDDSPSRFPLIGEAVLWTLFVLGTAMLIKLFALNKARKR